MNDDILHELVAATLRLREDRFWLHLLSENLMCASCEGFVQSSVLGAFNLSSRQFVATRENVLRWDVGKVQPDLSILRPASYSEWWESTPDGRAGMVLGAAQLTMVWTRGSAEGSAVVTQKAPKIARDAAGLSNFTAAHVGVRAYLGVLTSGVHAASAGRSALDDAAAVISGRLEAHGVATEHEERVGMLANQLLDHWTGWSRASPESGVWAEMCWFKLRSDPVT